MWNGIDRRKFPRVHYRCVIYMRKKGSTKTISTRTENLGAGGICVIVKEDLGLFRGVDLELDLEDETPLNIKCSGTVVWVVKKRDPKEKGAVYYDTGIEFVDINEDGKNRISKIVEAQLKK
ncbi:MAG: PilZ domain-containing protein [Candidatus Omnitrophota bacterium]